MKIAYIFLPGRLDRINSKDEQEMPTEFFYGALELRQKGYHVNIFEAEEKPRRSVFRYISEFILLKKYLPIKTNTSILDAVWCLLPKLKEYDVVVATTTGIAFSLVIWKILYRLPFSVIGIMNAILNYKLNYVRVKISRLLFNRMDVHLFGEAELEPMCREYGIPPEDVTVNYFGVDCLFWKGNLEKEDKGYVLAIGNDSMRDFSLLLEVAKRIERQVIIVTRRELPDHLPANVHIIRGAWYSQELDDVGLRNMYQEAFCIITPLKESFQPSGQSVTLQAMACEKPVIMTKTSGLWDSRNLKHGENLLFVDPGDAEQIIASLKDLDEYPIVRSELCRNARKYVIENAQIDFFAGRLEESIRSINTELKK